MNGLTELMPSAGVTAIILIAVAAPSATLAQTAAEWAEQDRHCMALRTLQTEEHLRLKEEWVRGTFQAIDAKKQEECRDLYEEAVQALEDDEVVESSAAALPSAALVQTAAEWAERDRHCMALRTLQTEEYLRLREEWVRGTFQAIDSGKQEECRELYEEAVEALGDDEAVNTEAPATVVRTPDEDGPLAPLR